MPQWACVSEVRQPLFTEPAMRSTARIASQLPVGAHEIVARMDTRQEQEFKSRNELLTQFMRRMPVRTALRAGVYVVVHETARSMDEPIVRPERRISRARN